MAEVPAYGNHTKLGDVICEPAESRAWDKNTEVVPGFVLRAWVIIVGAGAVCTSPAWVCPRSALIKPPLWAGNLSLFHPFPVVYNSGF